MSSTSSSHPTLPLLPYVLRMWPPLPRADPSPPTGFLASSSTSPSPPPKPFLSYPGGLPPPSSHLALSEPYPATPVSNLAPIGADLALPIVHPSQPRYPSGADSSHRVPTKGMHTSLPSLHPHHPHLTIFLPPYLLLAYLAMGPLLVSPPASLPEAPPPTSPPLPPPPSTSFVASPPTQPLYPLSASSLPSPHTALYGLPVQSPLPPLSLE